MTNLWASPTQSANACEQCVEGEIGIGVGEEVSRDNVWGAIGKVTIQV